MKKKIFISSIAAIAFVVIAALAFVFIDRSAERYGEDDMYDGLESSLRFEVQKTLDPKLGYVPSERLISAINAAAASKANALRNASRKGTAERTDAPQFLSWTERGPSFDISAGGNPRPGGTASTSGRLKTILVDANDATGNTVFVGGADGGIWKTTNVNSPTPNWVPINDLLSNLAVSDIAQDPRPGFRNVMYFTTGEALYLGPGIEIRGQGVFKSTNGGASWSQLASTASFIGTSRIIVDGAGKVYVAGRSIGVRRSDDSGANWTDITPAGVTPNVSDMELSSTGRLHVTFGFNGSPGAYRYTDVPQTVTSASGWAAPNTGFPVSNRRIEIGVAGNTVYSAPVTNTDPSNPVPVIYVSTNGGADWTATVTQPPTWASQADYCLSVTVNPVDPNQVIVGGLDNYRSINGGQTWTKISEWVGSTGQYVHADQQRAFWYPDGQRVLFANDGGLFYSGDGGTTITDRNRGLRIKQFYSVSIHPTLTNVFLAGAQDNGHQRLSGPGLGGSDEVVGGDGAFSDFDVDTPNNAYAFYVENRARYSTNSGVNWTFCPDVTTGHFINPWALDSTANIIYSGDAVGTYRRWTGLPGCTSAPVAISGLTGGISAVKISPNSPNTIFIGTDNGNLVRIDNADTFSSGTAASATLPSIPGGGWISSITAGTTDNYLIATVSSYGGKHVYYSANRGVSWTAVDGNLPDMPVRSALFSPGLNNAAIIATETGVWETSNLNAASPVWVANPSFPTVRTDMLRYRASDGLIAAATFGRGIWTSKLVATAASVSVSGRVFAGSEGRGLKNARVVITSNDGTSQTVLTGPKGMFEFANVQAGQTYVVTVASRRFAFEPKTITVEDSIGDIAFYPSTTGEKVRR